MTHQRSHGSRATVAGAVLVLLVLSSSPAFAGYRAWFSPWDYAGNFQPGDVSEDFTTMIPPDGACGLRITDPSYYRWTDDVDATVASHDLYDDVIIGIDNPGEGCSRPFSVRYWEDSVTFALPESGGVAMEMFTNYGAYWVNDNGYYLHTCGECVGPDDLTEPPDDQWSLPAASAFTAVSAAILDVRRQLRVPSAIANLSRHVSELQLFLRRSGLRIAAACRSAVWKPRCAAWKRRPRRRSPPPARRQARATRSHDRAPTPDRSPSARSREGMSNAADR